jgi:hypothetical protein
MVLKDFVSDMGASAGISLRIEIGGFLSENKRRTT